VDLNATLREVLGDLETSLSRTGGQVDVGRLPAVQANPARMQQLFLNLLGNGLKFHRQEVAPRVGVYAGRAERRDDQEWVWVAVQDNGIGFEVEELDRLVQPFVRLHGRSDYEGSGIGLAICRRIVEQLGGELTAESAPGQGSTFWVRLPLAGGQPVETGLRRFK
jgi:signal transduction histidine kinase